jgi:hypothetical protein
VPATEPKAAGKALAAEFRRFPKGVRWPVSIPEGQFARACVSVAHCVLDAPATFAWLCEDEASPVADALLDPVTEHGAVVPSLWFLERANGLAMAERRGRIDTDGCTDDRSAAASAA